MASEKNLSRDAMASRDINRQNYFYKRSNRWRKIGVALSCINKEAKRNYLAGILGGQVCVGAVPPDFTERFRDEMRAVQDDLKRCLEKYFPADLREKLAPLPIAELEPLDALNEIAYPANMTYGEQRRFEILRLMEVALEYAHLSNQLGTEACRHTSPEDKKWADIEQSRLTAFLSSLGMGLKISLRNLVVYLDPANKWICKKVCWLEEDTDEIKAEMAKRGYVRVDKRVYSIAKKDSPSVAPNGAAVLVESTPNRGTKDYNTRAVIQGRQKSFFEAFAKRFRCVQGQFDIPADLFGFRVACFSKKDMDTWLNFFEPLSMNPYRKIRKIPRRNQHAARRLRLFSHPIFLNGRPRELQYIHIADITNITYSTRVENHDLYHFRCYADVGGLFEQLWPEEIYGINWQNPITNAKCRQHIIATTIAANERLRS